MFDFLQYTMQILDKKVRIYFIFMLFYFVVECACNQCVQVNIVFKNHVWDQELFTGKELHLKRHTKKKLGALRCQPINLEILKSNSAVRGEMYMPLKTIHWASNNGHVPCPKCLYG